MFCPQCGSKFNDQYRFCCNCGFDSKTISNYDNITEVSWKLKENIRDMVFNGTEENFKEIYEFLLYKKVDFDKTLNFIQDAKKKFPDKEFLVDFCEEDLQILKLIENIDKQGFVETIFAEYQKTNEQNDIESLANLAGDCVIAAFYGRIWIARKFSAFQFVSLWSADIAKKEQLELELENTKNETRKDTLTKEIEGLKSKWEEFHIEFYIKTFIEKSDLTHISMDFNTYSSQYSVYIDLIYEKVLENAIKIHKANYLHNMHPTVEQKEKIRTAIKNKFLYVGKSISTVLSLTYHESEKCLYLIKDIDKLNKKYDSDSLLKKGAVTAGLMFLAGPIGILNAVREVSNYSENSDQIDELNKQLNNNFDSFLSEFNKTDIEICRSYEDVESFIKEYGKVTLSAAIKNIFDKLIENSETIRPLKKYFI